MRKIRTNIKTTVNNTVRVHLNIALCDRRPANDALMNSRTNAKDAPPLIGASVINL